jgi:hypothetical protein
MLVRLLRSVPVLKKDVAAGTVIDMDPRAAARWCAEGLAEPVEGGVETSMAAAPRTATLSVGPAREVRG